MIQDLRIALRTLRKSPGYTAVAISILGLGIGATTAVFSAVNGTLLRPLPYPESERLLQVWETDPGADRYQGPVSPLNLDDWREASATLEAIAGYAYDVPVLTGGDAPERLYAITASTSFFSVFRVQPLLGRTFRPEDEGAPVVVLAYSLWQGRFGGDPDILGRALTLDGRPHTVVGVMPEGFRFPRVAQLWIPLSIDRSRISRGEHFLFCVGRLVLGASLEAAQSEMSAIARRLAQEHPDTNEGQGVRLVPLREQLVGGLRPQLLILFGAVALVLLSACANVANLLMVRAAGRQKEVALRSALGASRPRLVRQLLMEALVLAIAAGALGVALASLGLDLLLAAGRIPFPRAESIDLDGQALSFALLASLVTGVAFGLAPAWQATGPEAQRSLRESASTGGPRSQRLRRLFVSTEVALAVVLLAGAGLLGKSFLRLSRVDPGFQAEGLLTLRLELTSERYREPAAQAEFVRRAAERIAALPDARRVGAVSDLPFSGSRSRSSFLPEGRPDDADGGFDADVRSVTPGYLATLGVPLGAGRHFDERDTRESNPVLIVNSTFTARFFPGENPIGRRVRLGGPSEVALYGGPVWREIVGVVGDIRHDDLSAEAYAEMYVPFGQRPERRIALAVRTPRPPRQIVPSIRAALRELDAEQPLYDIRTMEDRLAASVAAPRFHAGLLAVFAGAALLLAVLGIYGVVSYSVAQRTREIGVRVALGADRADVRRLIVAGGLRSVVAGLAAGLVLAAALARILAGTLWGVSPYDPAVFAGVVLLLGGVALLASYAPARRAARTDPMEALRES